jgi:hypothetical protein
VSRLEANSLNVGGTHWPEINAGGMGTLGRRAVFILPRDLGGRSASEGGASLGGNLTIRSDGRV